MKHITPCTVLLPVYLALAAPCMAQPITGKIEMTELVDPEWQSMTKVAGAQWDAPGVDGSLFYTDDWVDGYVVLSGNRLIKSVPLRFNVYTNELYFKKGDNVLVLDPATAPVEEFGFTQGEQEQAVKRVFRCGYPATGDYTTKTFYEALVNDKLSLLVHLEKKISDRLNAMKGPEKIVIDSESWFVYTSGSKELTAIKKNRKALEEALPAYAAKIESVTASLHLKLKTDNDWVTLFSMLNK
jgi:hypothetical protein